MAKWLAESQEIIWQEVWRRHQNVIIYGTSHPELGHAPLRDGSNLARLPPETERLINERGPGLEEPIVDWYSEAPRVRSDLPPVSWRTLKPDDQLVGKVDSWLVEDESGTLPEGVPHFCSREEEGRPEGSGTGRELEEGITVPPLKGGYPQTSLPKKAEKGRGRKSTREPTPPGESAGGSPPGRVSGRRRPGGGKSR